MRILVIGGTQFAGRHVVEAALAAGDELTLFHRGRTNPGLFAGVEHRLGDRDSDLAALAAGRWDATIDCCAYVPRQVHSLARVLGGRGGRYVHISSVSAYAEAAAYPGMTEDAPLAALGDPAAEEVNDSTYGGLKALCEQAALAAFGARGSSPGTAVSIVRPTYVAGPFDHTRRFTWWVERIAAGGRVLAPGPADNPFQVIDARDLAAFIVLLAHGGAAGIFHAVSPPPPFSFGDFLATVVGEVGPPGTELAWVSATALTDAGVTQADLPLWEGTGSGRNLSAAAPGRAIAAGLRPRPLAQTISEIHEHELRHPAPQAHTVGLDPARERELLEAN